VSTVLGNIKLGTGSGRPSKGAALISGAGGVRYVTMAKFGLANAFLDNPELGVKQLREKFEEFMK
jgi:hypothetical protein